MHLNNTPYNDDASTPKKSSTLKKVATTLGVLSLLVAVGAAAYFYRELSDIKKNPNKVAEDETKALIDKVGKLIVLPVNEQPTVATVTDLSKLKDQPFFAQAKEGYKVLIFTNAKKAILYNPVENQIVEVAPVNIGDTAATVDGTNVSGTTTDSTNNLQQINQ